MASFPISRQWRWLPVAISVLICSTQAVGAHVLKECNSRPVIGVLSVPMRSSICATVSAKEEVGALGQSNSNGSEGIGSCFDAVYVKWLEAAGARVLPIRYDDSEETVRRKFQAVNGVLFTGGGEVLTNLSSQFMRTAGLLFNLTLEANARQDYFPLWGTCMGFQVLNILAARDSSVLSLLQFDSEGLSLPLRESVGWNESRLISSLPSEVSFWLRSENITTNFHHDGVKPSAYERNERLSNFFRVISTNKDRKGVEFVSTIESFHAPIYGVQWHPERNQFEFKDSKDPINHQPHAIKAMGSVAEFFVNEARKSCHEWHDSMEEDNFLIYHYAPGPVGGSSQHYTFSPVQHHQMNEIKIVLPMMGGDWTIDAKYTWTIKEVKQKIEEKYGFPFMVQHLRHNGSEMGCMSSHTLEQLRVTEYSKWTLTPRGVPLG
mmetsp:Transcript_30109/g.52910  ORF Transcript_30109/g.52910 Transcript_30109/m.52910 type:complete len:434 (-) Transcript_30109:296-1597(-)